MSTGNITQEGFMSRDDIARTARKAGLYGGNRLEAEIFSWQQRYEALLKTLVDQKIAAPPMMLADKQSYELGLLHGAANEREACAKVAEKMLRFYTQAVTGVPEAIRARSNS